MAGGFVVLDLTALLECPSNMKPSPRKRKKKKEKGIDRSKIILKEILSQTD